MDLDTDRPRCANPECGQDLLLVREGRTRCYRCEQAAGGDPWRWTSPDR